MNSDKYFSEHMTKQLSPIIGHRAVSIVRDEGGFFGLIFDNGCHIYFESDSEANQAGWVSLYNYNGDDNG